MKKAAPVVLLVIGLMQMAGDVTGFVPLRDIGAASAASPAPKVFTSANGLETFSTRFFVEWESADGQTRSVEVTQESYARLRGPYIRREVYGAALAYGPVLEANERTRTMFRAVSAYALCGKAPLLRELGIVPDAGSRALRIRYEPAQPPPSELSLWIDPRCP